MDDQVLNYGAIIGSTLRAYMDNSGRSKQAEAGIIGPSDLGFCRQRAALMTRGIPATDSTSKWAAAVGTAMHNYIEAALAETFPDWLLGSIHHLNVTARFPSGAEISGHPDIVIPGDQVLLDTKTVDGFATVRREGATQAHKFQRHTYALGCIQTGIFDESKPVYVGNIYFDRSGKEEQPLLVIEEFDPTLTDAVDAWITDVIYAVRNNEDAMRDLPAPICERICGHYSACRGDLPIGDDAEFITAPELLSAVDMYNEARDMEKMAKQMKDEAAARLNGVNGSTGKWTVRWTQVNPSRVEAFDKAGYLRLDVRKSR